MKKILFTSLAICFSATLMAQSIGPDELKSIRESFVKDGATVAAQNAIQHTRNLNALCRNVAAEKLDNNFRYKVKALPTAPDQGESGRCWLFASLNGIRHYAIDKYNVNDFRFSNNYCAFWDLFEKCNLFLEEVISTVKEDDDSRMVACLFKAPLGDGGVWNMFVNVAEKYGVVPESAMPETIHSMYKERLPFLQLKLRREGMILRDMAASGSKTKELRKYKVEAMKDIYRILCLCLGEPPVEFTWNYVDRNGARHTIKTTPKEFYKSIVPADFGFNTKIMVMNDPTREYYKVYEIKDYTDVIEGMPWRYLNLPNDEIKAAVLKMIKAGEAVYASADWRKGKENEGQTMTCDNYDFDALFGVKFGMDKKNRILSRYSSSAHAMLIVACDTDETDKPTKWQFFNSWFATGEKAYLTFTDEWFDEYMFREAINRDCLSEKAVKALSTKPVMLPFWDYQK